MSNAEYLVHLVDMNRLSVCRHFCGIANWLEFHVSTLRQFAVSLYSLAKCRILANILTLYTT